MFSVSQDTLKVAFIGGALHSAVGRAHFSAIHMDGLFQVTAGCFSQDQEKNKDSAKFYNISPARVYEKWEDLLDKEQGRIDAVVVLTPTPTHAKIVISAIKKGYPVICEKALATSVSECEDVLNAVELHNGFLAVTFNYSGYPMVRELQKIISQGKFGKIQQIHVEMPQEGFLRRNASPQKWRSQDYKIPTVSLDLGVHVHHLIDFLSGGLKHIAIQGCQKSYGSIPGVIDNVYLMAEYEENLHVQAWWSKTTLGYRNGLRLRVYGETGSAHWHQMNPEFLECADNVGNLFKIDRASCFSEVSEDTRYNRFKAGHPSGFIEAFANLYWDIGESINNYKSSKPYESPYVHGVKHSLSGLHLMEDIAKTSLNFI